MQVSPDKDQLVPNGFCKGCLQIYIATADVVNATLTLVPIFKTFEIMYGNIDKKVKGTHYAYAVFICVLKRQVR